MNGEGGYAEYISRQGRGKLAQILYDVAVEKVKQDNVGVVGKRVGRGRPKGDAYKLAGEWLGMSKTNFYYLIQGRYGTSNAMVKCLIDECGKVKPNETYNLLHHELVESQKQIENEIERFTTKYSPSIVGDKRNFPRRIRAP